MGILLLLISATSLLLLVLLLLRTAKPQMVTRTAPSAILDSCALIDGRVVELAKLGFAYQRLIVPNFILQELQMLADGRDAHKRERARFGLQVVKQLQAIDTITVDVDAENPIKETVDDKLVALAKKRSAALFTTDFNLNQVASIDGVLVLNVNELAHALRPVVLPGEELEITVTQAGTNRDQGVGYLPDGTMVVVDGAIRDIGKRVTVHITKSHQTVAGKMLFAKRISAPVTKSDRLTPPTTLPNRTYKKRHSNKTVHHQ